MGLVDERYTAAAASRGVVSLPSDRHGLPRKGEDDYMARDSRLTGNSPLNEESYVGRKPISPYPHAMPYEVPGSEPAFDRPYIDRLVSQVQRSLDDIAQFYVDQTNRVDEYRVQGNVTGGESLTTQFILPDYECDEIITSIIVTGTPAGAFNLQLGKRDWNLIIPATGILILGPVQIKLGRSDIRQLTAAVAGDWAFELSGYAETGRRGRV